ncbi:hypothetical protein ACQ86O_17280 [Serratia sp. L9]|uniref:hypothetical protein n=1 Tax=Serratia sp. L9 TaxID=3423946 RepID=UPI003D67D311
MWELAVESMSFIFERLKDMIDNGDLSSLQAVFIVFLAASLIFLLYKIKEVISFFNEIRNKNLNYYHWMLENYRLIKIDKKIIKTEMSRIIRYRMSGIQDVARQSIIFRLIYKNKELISPDFFKKFRNFLVMKDGVIIFNKGLGFRLECFMYGLFSVQYLLVAFSFMALSIYKGDSLSLWKHLILYSMSIILFMFFVAFWKMIPSPKECRLLSEILQKQNIPSSYSD